MKYYGEKNLIKRVMLQKEQCEAHKKDLLVEAGETRRQQLRQIILRDVTLAKKGID